MHPSFSIKKLYPGFWFDLTLCLWFLFADDVGYMAAFLASPLAGAVTGSVVYVDNGLHCMGAAIDSPALSKAADAPAAKASVPA
jgi:hypothetical protein